jgi:hypothetical protein
MRAPCHRMEDDIKYQNNRTYEAEGREVEGLDLLVLDESEHLPRQNARRSNHGYKPSTSHNIAHGLTPQNPLARCRSFRAPLSSRRLLKFEHGGRSRKSVQTRREMPTNPTCAASVARRCPPQVHGLAPRQRRIEPSLALHVATRTCKSDTFVPARHIRPTQYCRARRICCHPTASNSARPCAAKGSKVHPSPGQVCAFTEIDW